jgi:hypothetical protein
MALLMIDFTYMEGRDGELVVKGLAVADSLGNRVSSYVFKRQYAWEQVPMFNARINKAMDHGCNWDDGDIVYSQLQIFFTAKHYPLLQYIALELRK